MKLSLSRKAGIAFAVAFASIAALGLLQYRSTRRLAEDSLWVSHTGDVLRELALTRGRLNRADASAQSFVITGDPSYLDPYNQAVTALRNGLQTVRVLTADNPTQQQRLADLDQLADASIDAIQNEIDARQQAGPLAPEDLAPLETAVRKAAGDQRAKTQEIEIEEADMLRQRNATAAKTNQHAGMLVLAATLLAIALLAGSMFALYLDIAARAKAEEALSKANEDLRQKVREREQAEANFRSLLERAPDAMIVANREGIITLVNTQAEKLFGHRREELLGQAADILVPERFRSATHGQHAGFFGESRVSPVGASLDPYGLRKDGTEFPLAISLSPIQTAQGTLITGAIRDITEQRNRETALRQLSGQLLRAQELERRHVARELHDSVGQYLVALKMGLDFLQSGASPNSEDALTDCIYAADEAIKQVRTVSYLLYPPMLEELGLQSAIPTYLEGFARRSGIRATYEIPTDLPPLSREAAVALFRILQESLTNVHRHSGSQTAQVSLTTKDGCVVLEVKDQGRGMPPESIAKFQQDLPGTLGVGLRGMRERLRQLGGKLQIDSTPTGTTVSATIPCDEPAASTPDNEPDRSRITSA